MTVDPKRLQALFSSIPSFSSPFLQAEQPQIQVLSLLHQPERLHICFITQISDLGKKKKKKRREIIKDWKKEETEEQLTENESREKRERRIIMTDIFYGGHDIMISKNKGQICKRNFLGQT